MGFWGAAAAPWRGLWLIVTTPRAWLLAIVPMVIASMIILALSVVAFGVVPSLVGHVVGPTETWYGTLGKTLLEIVAALAMFIVALLCGAFLAQPIASPALDRLLRLTESSLGLADRPRTSFALDAWRSARSALIGFVSVPIVLVLTAIEILVPGSTWVILPIKLVITAIFVSWDLLDYPLGVRDLGLRDRLAWVFSHKREVMGFGLSLAGVFLIPCMQLVLLPAGVVGAALLVFAVEKADQGKAGALPPRATKADLIPDLPRDAMRRLHAQGRPNFSTSPSQPLAR